MDIFNAMKNGLTEEEIYEAFGTEMSKAKQKLQQESEKITKEKALDAARVNVIGALKNYYLATGVLDPEEWDEEMEAELEKTFKMLEGLIKVMADYKN